MYAASARLEGKLICHTGNTIVLADTSRHVISAVCAL